MMNDVKWGLFEVGEVFEVSNCKPYHNQNLSFVESLEVAVEPVNYVTRISGNNGVEGLVENEGFEVNAGNAITFGAETAIFFYQHSRFITGNKMYAIYNDNMDAHSGLFLTKLLNSTIGNSGYGYGMGLTGTRFKSKKVMLPINESGEINWSYMSKYSRNQEIESLEKAIRFLRRELVKVGSVEKPIHTRVEWRAHSIKSVIEVLNGVRLTTSNMTPGERPFIGATEYNNGITNFVDNTNKSLDNNVLGINYNGSVCEGFYHPYEAVFSDDVKRLKFKNGPNNEYLLHFLLTTIEKQRKKYQYGYKFNSARMNNQKIMLPTTPAGEPDYEFMENYIKTLKHERVTVALNFAEEKLKTLL